MLINIRPLRKYCPIFMQHLIYFVLLFPIEKFYLRDIFCDLCTETILILFICIKFFVSLPILPGDGLFCQTSPSPHSLSPNFVIQFPSLHLVISISYQKYPLVWITLQAALTSRDMRNVFNVCGISFSPSMIFFSPASKP